MTVFIRIEALTSEEKGQEDNHRKEGETTEKKTKKKLSINST